MKVQEVDKLLGADEVEVLEEIFLQGKELEMRSLQAQRMAETETDSDWKDRVECVPQCILEKLMHRLGFFSIDEEDQAAGDIRVNTTANMEAAVIASLIWR